MLILLVILPSLILLSLATGLLVLQAHSVKSLRTGDAAMTACWLGFLLFSAANLAVSLFMPLTSSLLVIEAVLIAAAALSVMPVRNQLTRIVLEVWREHAIQVLALMAFAAAAGAQLIVNRDGLSYQFDHIQLLSRIGTAPGMGLVESRFGFSSSWLTVPALLNHGFLTARTAMLSNAVLAGILFLQLYVLSYRVLRKAAGIVDFMFLPAFFAAALLPLVLNMTASPSHDMPVIALSIATAWMICLSTERDSEGSRCMPLLLPFLLGALALTVKLSAVPITAAAALSLVVARPGVRRLIPAALYGAAVIALLCATSIVSTGHWFYPLPLAADLPWTLGSEVAEIETRLIENYARWGKGTVPDAFRHAQYPSIKWLSHWIALDVSNLLGFAAFVATVAAAPFIFAFKRRERSVAAWPLLLGVAGIAFLLMKAPASRFGWGYLVMVPCTFAGLALGKAGGLGKAIGPRKAVIGSLALPGLLLAADLLWVTQSERRMARAMETGDLSLELTNMWIQPSVIPNVTYNDSRNLVVERCDHTGANHLFTTFDRPPYYPASDVSHIALRSPDRGPRAGYAKTKEWIPPSPSIYR